jgi:CDP-diacylglycerol--serine O-phosphatidyltransferase
MTDSKKKDPILPRSRGIYLLPNLFTVGVLFAAFYAIVAASNLHFEASAIAIFVGMLLDSLDGRIARLTHTQTEFGAQMDSLSDMVCFGITPSLVFYSWNLNTLGKVGWLAAFFYTVCTALRLARFNSQSQSENKRYFQGLSTTAAAGCVAGYLWVCIEFSLTGPVITWIGLVMMILLGLFKVSTIRYRSFKDIDLRGPVSFIAIITAVLVFVFISFNPPITLFVIFLVYVLSGPLSTLWGLSQNRRNRKQKLHLKSKNMDQQDESGSSKGS